MALNLSPLDLQRRDTGLNTTTERGIYAVMQHVNTHLLAGIGKYYSLKWTPKSRPVLACNKLRLPAKSGGQRAAGFVIRCSFPSLS